MTPEQVAVPKVLTRLEVPVQVRRPGELGTAQMAELGLGQGRYVAPMGAHLANSPILPTRQARVGLG